MYNDIPVTLNFSYLSNDAVRYLYSISAGKSTMRDYITVYDVSIINRFHYLPDVYLELISLTIIDF